MIKVSKIEQIRRAYYLEGKSMRQIEREYHHAYKTIKKALGSAAAGSYTLKEPRDAPVLGPYKARIEELLAENKTLPRKQRRTGHQIFLVIRDEDYQGSESGSQNPDVVELSVKFRVENVLTVVPSGFIIMQAYCTTCGNCARPNGRRKCICRWSSSRDKTARGIGARPKSCWPASW